jgi:hypothetical protein
MRKWMSFLVTFLVGASSYANANNGTVAFEVGYRQDNVSLTKDFDHDLKIHHHFKDLDIFQIGVKAKGALGCNFYGRAEGSWGWVLDGEYEQRLSAHGRGSCGGSFEFTDSIKNVVDDRYVFDANVAVGYPFYFCDCTLSLAPVVGYSFDEQNLRVDNCDGDDSYYDCGGFDLADGCCKHKFINRWYGPFLGVDFEYRPYNECWNVFAELEFHWAHYKGRRQDGLGSDGFTTNHSHHGHGYVFNVGAEYDFCNCWTTSLAVKFTDFHAHKNHHCSNDSSSSSYDYSSFSFGESHGGKAKWRSVAVTLAVGYGF